PRDKPVEPRELCSYRYICELADVRRGAVGQAYAVGAGKPPVTVLVMIASVPRHRRSLMRTAIASVMLFTTQTVPAGQSRPGEPIFRASASLVTVDVVVRDASGAVVRGLTANDFTILEDGRPQSIQTFSFAEISTPTATLPQNVAVLGDVRARLKQEVQ